MSALTPMKLNEQIISMRKSVERARVRLCRRLIRRRKLLQKSKDEKKVRKVDRITKEIDRCKKVCRDDVSKFALINLKALNDLLKKRKMSADERVLCKLACQQTVIKSVEEFRSNYPNWQHEVSFLLQRLGLQYKSKRDAKKHVLPQSETELAIEASVNKKTENVQDMKMLVKKEIRKAMKKEILLKKKLKDKTKSDEHKEMPIPVLNLPKLEFPQPVIAKGQAVIEVLSLDGNQGDEFASISAPDKIKDVVLEGNAKGNVTNENDGANGSSLSIKTRDDERQKGNIKYKEDKKRKSSVTRDKSGADSFSEGHKTKLLEYQNLHPSWIAKKEEAEALKKLKATCKAKKIVFDDD